MTDENKQVLIKILQDVFTEEELKTICENNTSQLQGNPYHEISGNTVNARYSSLVNHLIRGGLINSFLDILCQDSERFANLVQSLRSETTIQNANNIVDYLFVIVKPQTNQKFYIEAQLARFINNQTKQKKDDYELPIQIQQPEDGCEKKHIIGVLDKIIQEMYKTTRDHDMQLSRLPIIELFLPINLLSEGFDSGEIMDEWGKKTPIGKLYPVIIRSYDRFLHNEKNKARLKLAWQPQWESLEKIINDNNAQQFINIIKNNNTYVRFIDDPLPNQKKRIELFQEILSKGFPLCLWTRYKTIDNNVVKKFETIFAIDLNDTNNFCKIYRIYQNIHDIRINNMKTKSDFGYNLGVLFDHDKIPTGANQLISPNMARLIKKEKNND